MGKKVKINRNIFWAELFLNELVKSGMRDAVVSPGSRNTPLALAVGRHSQVRSYASIDERSGGFFALGIAKQTTLPVMLISTSGTAAAEFYPAVIEAYHKRIPLIVCTADRPYELHDCGANQTINQNYLYGEHTRWFFNVGIPELTKERLKHIRLIARRSFSIASDLSRGPVHLNFPFREPLEPYSDTDLLDEVLLERKDDFDDTIALTENSSTVSLKGNTTAALAGMIKERRRGLLVVGEGEFNGNFKSEIIRLSKIAGYPILADPGSQLRCGNLRDENILTHYDSYLKSNEFVNSHNPELMFHFGGNLSSKGHEELLKKSGAVRYYINRYGDWIDPANSIRNVLHVDPENFCRDIVEQLTVDSIPINKNWIEDFRLAEVITLSIRQKYIDCIDWMFEGKIIQTVFNALPEESELMVSNSMPIRDLDSFLPNSDKRVKIYMNRGSSGIDGIISTALGIAVGSGKVPVLITGDLALYHDINALGIGKKYNIPLLVILINNNGGGIFEMLPIANSERDIFEEYFITPHDVEFKLIVEGFGGGYKLVSDWKELTDSIIKGFDSKRLKVIEIKTDAVKAAKIRKEYWEEVDKEIKIRNLKKK